jgi:hypothetical protein
MDHHLPHDSNMHPEDEAKPAIEEHWDNFPEYMYIPDAHLIKSNGVLRSAQRPHACKGKRIRYCFVGFRYWSM